MARTHIDKRSQLVSAAVGLAYQFGATSLADIAREAEVPLGNVYYYFKTKDEIGEAIVELRLAELSAQRQRWNEAGSPKDRLCALQGVSILAHAFHDSRLVATETKRLKSWIRGL